VYAVSVNATMTIFESDYTF